MGDEGVVTFPADEQPDAGATSEMVASSDGDRALSRFLVGLLLLGRDELAQGLKGTAQPVVDAAPAAETPNDMLRHLALGLLVRGESNAGQGLRTVYYMSVGTANWTFHTIDRLTDNWLMRPLRRPVEDHVRRLGEQVAEIVEEGKREEQHSRAMAAESVGSVVENIFDQVAESEELDRLIKELVGQKSASFAGSLVDNVRALTATADYLVEGALRRLLRRPPRRALPPSPLEGQPQTMYASENLVRRFDDGR